MVTTGTLSDLCYHFIEPSQLSAWLMGIQPPSGMTSGTVVIHFPKRLLELYTHCTRQEITVKQAIDGELERSLVARRSAMAIQQLGQVNVILAQQSLKSQPWQRSTEECAPQAKWRIGYLSDIQGSQIGKFQPRCMDQVCLEQGTT
jgi:hypothetical protein